MLSWWSRKFVIDSDVSINIFFSDIATWSYSSAKCLGRAKSKLIIRSFHLKYDKQIVLVEFKDECVLDLCVSVSSHRDTEKGIEIDFVSEAFDESGNHQKFPFFLLK